MQQIRQIHCVLDRRLVAFKACKYTINLNGLHHATINALLVAHSCCFQKCNAIHAHGERQQAKQMATLPSPLRRIPLRVLVLHILQLFV